MPLKSIRCYFPQSVTAFLHVLLSLDRATNTISVIVNTNVVSQVRLRIQLCLRESISEVRETVPVVANIEVVEPSYSQSFHVV